jgi:hypothetical protein
MKNIQFIIVLLFFGSQIVYSQNNTRISGIIKDIETGEVLIGTTIIDNSTFKGTITDNNGYFSLIVSLPCTLQISYVGYVLKTLNISNLSDIVFFDIRLEPSIFLNVVVIKPQPSQNSNISKLSIKDMEQFPMLGGKLDVGRAMQILPGISSQREGSSTILVRGGDPGQNMYLFDNTPVLYVNHLAGFFSVFNPDIINNIEVYKGDFPPKYGGKISSYVDITQKEGNTSEFKGSLSSGLTDFSLSLEGPTKLRNSSFIFTARKTAVDLYLLMASSLAEGNSSKFFYGFHDLNGKFTWKPNNKNTLSYNFYYGDDYLKFWRKPDTNVKEIKNHHSSYLWGNIMNSVNWKTNLNSKLFISTNASYSRYRVKDINRYEMLEEENYKKHYYKYLSSVDDFSIRSTLNYSILNNWRTFVGVESSLKNYLPVSIKMNNNLPEGNRYLINEHNLHANNEVLIKNFSKINIGCRLLYFNSHDYKNLVIEPRLNLTFIFLKNHNIKASYSKVTQNNHLIFSSGNFLLNEVWIPATEKFIPARAKHYTLGWEGSFAKNSQQSSIVFYYKEMSGLLTYKEGYTNLKGDENWMSKIESNGIGNSYGMEIFTKKTFNNVNVLIAYTLSKTTRNFPNINQNNEYLYEFDRPHDFSISINFKFSEKLNFNIFWTFQTGLPYTPVIGKQYTPYYEPNSSGEVFFIETLIYGDRNSERMKNYHRLDIGLNYEYVNKKNRKAIWSFSIYNAYNRKNPYYYYYNVNETAEIHQIWQGSEILPLKLYQMTLFPIIPSFSYKVFFDKTNYPKLKKINLKKWLYYEK